MGPLRRSERSCLPPKLSRSRSKRRRPAAGSVRAEQTHREDELVVPSRGRHRRECSSTNRDLLALRVIAVAVSHRIGCEMPSRFPLGPVGHCSCPERGARKPGSSPPASVGFFATGVEEFTDHPRVGKN